MVLLTSLELLVNNTSIMDNLDKCFANLMKVLQKPGEFSSERISSDHEFNIFTSLFSVWTSCLALAVGYYVGSSTYKLIIKKYGETAIEKAVTLAGPVCLIGVTTAGYILGFAVETFLSIDFTLNTIFDGFFVGFSLFFLIKIFKKRHLLLPNFLPPFTGSAVVLIVFLIIFLFQTKMTLCISLTAPLGIFYYMSKPSVSKITFLSMSVMWIVIVGFYVRPNPIAELPLSNSISAVIRCLFIWVLALQMLMVELGKLTFISWENEGAVKIYASSAALGSMVLMVVGSVQHVLGPGPTIGALVGVAGAAGVSLAAAEAATQKFGDGKRFPPGKLGGMLGLAGGAFYSSSSHSGLLGVFMGVCTAAACAVRKPFLDGVPSVNNNLLQAIMRQILFGISASLIIRLICMWFYFTCTILGLVALIKFSQMPLFAIFSVCIFSFPQILKSND